MKHWQPAIVALIAVVQFAHAASELTVLPPEAQAHAALDKSPQIVVARAKLDIGTAERRRIQGGVNEWEVSVLQEQRTDAFGARFQEQEYGLSRRLRWPNKYLLDQRIGDTTTDVASYAFEDAWHEAGRSLLASWFNCLRAQSDARLLGEQVQVLQQQTQAVEKRVAAGDAPTLERAQAQAELERVQVMQSQAEQSARSTALSLQREFPDITALAQPTSLDAPPTLIGTDEEWLARIMGENHEIKLAEGEAALAKLRAQRASQERLADPTLNLHYSDNKDGNRKLLGLTVSMPIGGSARRSDYAIANSNARVAEQNLRAARLKVESDGRHDLLNVRSSYQQWQRLQAINEQSSRNAELVQRGYSLGEFTYGELQTARRQSLETAASALSAQLNTLEAYARLMIDSHLLWAPTDDEPEHTRVNDSAQ